MSKERAPARSYAEWDRLVDEWALSGETQEKFAQSHGINPRTFQGRVWKSRKRRGLSRKSKEPVVPSGFVEVMGQPSASTSSQTVGECRISMHSTKIEFTSMSDANWVSEILSKLGEGLG